MADDDPTPRVSGTLHRWPIFQDLAQTLAESTGVAALRATKVLAEIDLKRARRLNAIATEAEHLATMFETWKHGDPGQDLRTAAITKLCALREQARLDGVPVED